MSTFGNEEDLLAELIGHSEAAKGISGANKSSMAQEDDVAKYFPLWTQAYQRKWKATASSKPETALVAVVPVSQAVTLTGLEVGEHVEVTPAKKTKVVSPNASAPASAQGKMKAIVEDTWLEDEGFIRHVARRLRHVGLDRISQLHGSLKKNIAKAFDSVLRGLHSLYLVDELEEDVVLKEQVAVLESGLSMERVERKHACRQQDAVKRKMENTTGELRKVKDRVSVLERELSEV